MKLKLSLIVVGIIGLSSCATFMGPETQPSITQKPDQKLLNTAFNTAKDNVTKSWVGSDQDVRYRLTTTNTHVNYQGVPCRDFSLVTSKSFYRGDTLTGTACRYDGQWTDTKENTENNA
jgi:hypothetical protein